MVLWARSSGSPWRWAVAFGAPSCRDWILSSGRHAAIEPGGTYPCTETLAYTTQSRPTNGARRGNRIAPDLRAVPDKGPELRHVGVEAPAVG